MRKLNKYSRLKLCCFVLLSKMSKVAGCKRKLKTRTTTEKYKILKEVEKGESPASIPKTYGVQSKR